MTACVWVGYADSITPMTTLYNGGPVMGGTFPALIWASVVSAWEQIKAERAAEKRSRPSKARGPEARTPNEAEDETYVAARRRPERPNRSKRGGTGAANREKRRPNPKRAGRSRAGTGRSAAAEPAAHSGRHRRRRLAAG